MANDHKALQEYLIRQGIRFLKQNPLARHEDVRDVLDEAYLKGTAEKHPAFAKSTISTRPIKYLASVSMKRFRKKAHKMEYVIKPDFIGALMEQVKAKHQLEFHPLSMSFPLMSENELKALAESLTKNKTQRVTVYMFNSMVLDGKNRLLAAMLKGIVVDFVEYSGDDPITFLLERNVHRRHLRASQRAYVAAMLVTTERGSNQHTGISGCSASKVTQEMAGQWLSVSPDTISGAQKIIASGDDEIIQRFSMGKITVNKALTELERKNANIPVTVVDENEQNISELQKYLPFDQAKLVRDVIKERGIKDARQLIGDLLMSYYILHAPSNI